MTLYLVLASLLPVIIVSQDAQSLNGLTFSNELKRMDRNGIGAPNLQEYYDSLIYDKPTDTGTEIAHKMASNLGKMFETLTNQLQNVKRAIEDQYEHFSSSDLEIFPQCCKITGNYNPKFRTKVSESSACISKSTTSDHYPNKDIETVMKKNYERNPNILWQYFGGSDGTFLIYPSHGFSPNCFSYDPRFRPYYVASATNKPKDVVVAVDTSGITTGRSSYESRTLLSVAREAVQYVIDTLNPNDRIGIVAFNEEVIKPTSCHGTHLAKATTTNKEVLKRFTNDWVSSKQSHYDEGIKAAFSYFNIKDISTQGGERESVILFLAAGDNAGDDPVDVIKTENEARNNSVTILTYSFGGGLSDHWKKVLQNMSKQVTNDRSFGPVKEGTYKEVKDDSLLRSDMASYYKDLSSTNLGSNPVFSVPYVDGRSKETGLITSLCLPVETSGSLRGVTCTDILLDELLSDITNFKQGELSYAFMIDGQGRVMVHYLQPTPNAITIDPDPIDIHVLEPSVDAKPMIESMKRGESGSNSFSYFRTISRGILEYEGIEARSVEADYSWTKVKLSDTADPVNKLSSVGYKIAPVLNSNVYIIIKKEELNSGTCCQNSGISPLEYTCTNSGSDCCLCHKIVPYDTCQEKTTSGEKYHTCSARLPDSNVKVQPELDKIKELDLKPCFDAGCNARDEKNCYQVAGCSWCVQDENGKPFSQSETCCNIIETCPFGKVQNQKKTQCLASQTPDHSAQADDTPIVAGGTGGGVVIIIILAIIIAVVCRKRNKKDDKKATYLTVVTDNPGFSSAEERRSESDTSINYLRGEDEGSHQSNQYIGMQSSDDGSCTAHVGDNPKKPSAIYEKSKDIAVWNDFLVIKRRPRKRQSIKRVTSRPTVKPTEAPKTTTSTPDPTTTTTTTATLKPEISGALLAVKTEEYSGMAMILYLALMSHFLGIAVSEGINSLTGLKFSKELKIMEERGICAPSLQNYYDTLLYDKPTDTAADIAQKMTSNLENIFKTLTDQLKYLKQVIAQEYDNFAPSDTGVFPQCCTIHGTYNPKFRTKISEDDACISKSPSSKHFPNQRIKTTMEENYRQNPNMLWQYFGGSDGTFLIYPSHAESQNCQSYDPRFKQYYVTSVTKKPKDLVIAVDVSEVTARRSNYNTNTLLHVAREAVQYVIDTLSPNDRIGLVAFNDQASTPPSCNGTQLARVTTTYKGVLKSFINTWNPSKQSHYDEGIQAAFSFFDRSIVETIGDERESVILFLAAGDNAGDDPVDVIKTENEARNNSVIILTYSFGKDLSNHSKDVLKDMSKQVRNDRSFGPIKEGTFNEVRNDSLLRTVMAFYYLDLFSTNLDDDPVFSVPYVDNRSSEKAKALITSLCLPVDKTGSLKGVTCTDILLDELLSDITNFKEGELSYAFMIDGQGRVMVHYLQPTPNAFTTDPDPIDIHKLEPSVDAKPMIESMKRGESGSATFSYSRTISRGELEYDGIETRVVEAEYSWRKVPGTNFSLCVVLGKNDQQSRLRPGQEELLTNGVFYYHRLEQNRQNTQKCRQYDRYATKERSMVMLSPHAFEKPYEYLYRNETQEAVFDYSDYLNSVHSQQADKALKLKDKVKSSIRATYMAEEFWKENQDQSQFVIWRYLATRDGHVRVYPAVEIPKNYDPFTRDWWRKTVAQKGKNVVISPYIDNWGAGLVISQCKAIFEGRANGLHCTDDIVDVVECIDYPYQYFSSKFFQSYPECGDTTYSCMVIDKSGFLVIYPSFSNDEEFTRKHLGAKVSLSDTDDPVNKLSSKGYMIAPVLNSNVFIVIKKTSILSGTCCLNSEKSPLVHTCSTSESDCCLCHKVVPYDTCEEKTSGDTYHICSARVPDSNVKVEKELDRIKELEPCFDVHCNTRNESNCKEVAGCSWCIEDENGNNLQPSETCCNVFETCPFGKVQSQKQTHCSAALNAKHFGSTDSKEVGTVTGSVIGVLLLIVILSVIIVIVYRKRRNDKEDPYYLDPTLDPCQNNPAFSNVA
ncbi:uncharacterized protein LOC133204808 [Saccostrea echinata]|uniref:uncharacterized protein LOC133204808 n=1 Tax=Saccostrea echinata TaxID=191078 RepID=UPI002A81759D|nr:uncharacterized protein LOC133204808 [Saccostrea echinata]